MEPAGAVAVRHVSGMIPLGLRWRACSPVSRTRLRGRRSVQFLSIQSRQPWRLPCGPVLVEALRDGQVAGPERMLALMPSWAISIYCDGLPLYRQSSILAREGVEIEAPRWRSGSVTWRGGCVPWRR
jgi:hypothetical protein